VVASAAAFNTVDLESEADPSLSEGLVEEAFAAIAFVTYDFAFNYFITCHSQLWGVPAFVQKPTAMSLNETPRLPFAFFCVARQFPGHQIPVRYTHHVGVSIFLLLVDVEFESLPFVFHVDLERTILFRLLL
jgi:hypothetical protein